MSMLIIVVQELRRVASDRRGLLMTLAVPVVLIMAIGVVSGHSPLQAPPAGGFDAMSYIAPGMALFFLMMSVRQAARTIAEETDRGVRDRLRCSPAPDFAVTAGGTVSHVILLFLQLLVLIGISGDLYRLTWGPEGLVVLLCLVLAASASGWVALLVSVGRTPGRINMLGMVLTLAFGILGRSFAAVIPASPLMDGMARITPNYWGQHAFLALALGGGLSSIAGDLGALALMGGALWAASVLLNRRRTSERR
jgi:ABC-2 type transport system permease protein